MSDNLVKQWDDYVESMGSAMGEVEHMAQQMRARIGELEAKLAAANDLLDRLEQLNAQAEAAEQRGYASAMEAERKLHEDRIEELEYRLKKAIDIVDDYAYAAGKWIDSEIDYEEFYSWREELDQ